jgi:hypothetical protein
LTLACGGSDAPFESRPRTEEGTFGNVDDVETWVTSASAVSVYSHAYEVLAVSDGALTFGDAACPHTSDDGTTLTVTGGCTDLGQRPWSGTATVVRHGGDRTVTFEDFQNNDGTVERRELDATHWQFDVALTNGGVTTIDYSGSIEGGYDGPTIWNGSGHVERTGPVSPVGSVEATTVDELLDDAVCSGQPLSGSTTLYAGGDSAVVAYDGATDCDDERKARLVVNGKDRGSVEGIYCTTRRAGARRAGGSSAGVLLLIAFAAGIRRRRR